jgi:hypothetical protein
MATTTNYGWTTPDDTALVKDGAAAIRTLGSSIDTSLNTALGTKKAGLVLLNTTSFSGVTAQSFNNVFTSAYENYRVLFRGTSNTSVQTINLRMRASGTDATGANYQRMGVRASNGSSTLAALNQSAQTSIGLFVLDSSFPTYCGYTIDFIGPQLARITNIMAYGTEVETGTVYSRTVAGTHDLSTAYDGFSLINAGSVNFAATVSIYGYNI